MRLQYNSPVILTFALVSAAILVLTSYLGLPLQGLFSVCPNMSWGNPLSYIRLTTHVIGHANAEHLVGNFALILLIGPILEEKYGSKDLLIMIGFTAIITGLLQTFFFRECLLGASGVAFMLIILSSFTNYRSGHIPLTFLLVVALFLGKEVLSAISNEDQISQFAHIIGGISGAIFGFVYESRRKKR